VTVADSIVDGSARYAKGSESITIELRRIFDHPDGRVRSLMVFFVKPKASLHLLLKTRTAVEDLPPFLVSRFS
jgi:hypothetical protein